MKYYNDFLIQEKLQAETLGSDIRTLYEYEYEGNKNGKEEIIETLRSQGKEGNEERFIAVNYSNDTHKLFFTWENTGKRNLHYDMVNLLLKTKKIPNDYSKRIEIDGVKHIILDYNFDPRLLVGMMKPTPKGLHVFFESFSDIIALFNTAIGNGKRETGRLLDQRRHCEYFFTYGFSKRKATSSTIFYSRWGWLKDILFDIDKEITSIPVLPFPWSR